MRVLIAISNLMYCESTLQMGAEIGKYTAEIPTLLMVVKRENLKDRVAQTIKQAYEAVQDQIPELRTHVRVGPAAQEILAEAEEGEYDLVIVGNPLCRGLVARFVMDSTVEKVVENSPCPVLIAKGRIRPIRRILLCDSGAQSPSLLRLFTTRLDALAARSIDVTVLHVMSHMSAGPGVAGEQLRADAEELIRASTPEGDILVQDMALLSRFHVNSLPKVRHGLVVEEIVAESQSGDYDLVVTGARIGDGWQRLLLDDIGRKIIAQVDLPVLVLR